jgi:hypothetical protein
MDLTSQEWGPVKSEGDEGNSEQSWNLFSNLSLHILVVGGLVELGNEFHLRAEVK